MKNVGVITEYDPFHRGHALQLAQLRSMGAERIIVCMSCDAVQRGSFSILPPQVRAKAALMNGADLVLALPNPWACSGAESFAAAGVHLLSALSIDTLAFGAETPDASRHLAAARLLLGEQFPTALRRELQTGRDFASARAAAASALNPQAAEVLNRPNDILGVEYCKAILRQGCAVEPLALPRVGANHGEAAPTAETASGSAVRALWREQGLSAAAPWLPESAAALYAEAEKSGLLLDETKLEIALLSRLRALDSAALAQTRGLSEGLEHRLERAIRQAGSLDELYALLKTKRYSHARLRRLALDAALLYRENTLPPLPPFALVLGGKADSLSLCGKATLPCGTSLAALEKSNSYCAATARAHAAAANLAALCRAKAAPMGQSYTAKPVLL